MTEFITSEREHGCGPGSYASGTRRTARANFMMRLKTAGSYEKQKEMISPASKKNALKPKKAPIVYIGMNGFARDEAETLGDANMDHGGVRAVTPSRDQDKAKAGGSVHDLKETGGRESFASALGLDPEKAVKVAELLAGSKTALELGIDPLENARDEIAKVVKIYSQAEKGDFTMERVVLSGHSAGRAIWGDGNGMIDFSVFVKLAEIFPKAAGQVEDLMISACNTGGKQSIEQYFRMFPNLRTIWAYDGSSPGSWSGAMKHLKIWEKASEGKDPAKVDKELAKETRKGENVTTWNSVEGYKGKQ